MSLTYDGKKIIPAPLVTINKTYLITGAREKIGASYGIVLQGTLLPFRGSPSGEYTSLDNAFWDQSGDPPDETYEGNNEDFNHILRKQEALRYLFSDDGKSLEWQPSQGQPVMKCSPKILDITFDEGTWADRCDYTINFQADNIYIPGVIEDEDDFDVVLLESVTETWSFNETVGRNGTSYQATHSVNAKGIVGYDEAGAKLDGKEGWENAADWVNVRAVGSLDTAMANTALGTNTWKGGGYTRAVNISEENGEYSVTETFLVMPSNTFIEKQFSSSQNTTTDTIDVTYNGTVYGISNGGRTGGPQAIANAKAKAPSNAQAKADAETALSQFLGGYPLGVAPRQKQVTVNQKEGTVSFSFQWGADEDETFSATQEASIAFSDNEGQYTIVLNYDIEGKGASLSEKVDNARAAIPTISEARAIVINILGTAMPSEASIDHDPTSTSTAISETRGIARTSFTWKTFDDEFGDYSLDIATVYSVPVIVQIPIPGRANGPIVQDMNTITSQTVTVNYSSENNDTKPDDTTVADLMDNAGGIRPSWYLTSDSDDYNIKTKQYRRTRIHVVGE